jgi:hypothetical protein
MDWLTRNKAGPATYTFCRVNGNFQKGIRDRLAWGAHPECANLVMAVVLHRDYRRECVWDRPLRKRCGALKLV